MDNELYMVARHSQTPPVNLKAIFADLGIEYFEEPIFTGESGWIERNGDTYSITVDGMDPEPRKRFTAAHELAHYLLHRDLIASAGRMNRHTDRLYDQAEASDASPIKPYHEVQANRMAAQILMPATLIRSEYSKGSSTAKLAKDFEVSKAAMAIRLKTLGLPDR